MEIVSSRKLPTFLSRLIKFQGEKFSLASVDLEYLTEETGRKRTGTRREREGRRDNKALAKNGIVVKSFEIRPHTVSMCSLLVGCEISVSFANLFQRHGYSTLSNYRSSLLGPRMGADYYAPRRGVSFIPFSPATPSFHFFSLSLVPEIARTTNY